LRPTTAERLYPAARRSAAGAKSLSDLEEELKQTSAAQKIIGYAIQAHRAKQYAQPAALDPAA
jgi:hypothetical protein